MQITRATDYAVRVTIHLATISAATRVPVPVLASAIDAPESFVAKLMQQLVQAGLVKSRRGTGGGFQLARRAGRISLLEVVEAIEGPTHLNACIPAGPNCNRKAWCGAHPVFLKAQLALVKVLREASIARLARNSASNWKKFNHVFPANRVTRLKSPARRQRSTQPPTQPSSKLHSGLNSGRNSELGSEPRVDG